MPAHWRVVQPDVAKWGGVSGTLAVGRHARAVGARCCMHFMGTGLGLAASLHLLAVIGGDGRVELDINDNPLRSELGAIDLQVRQGKLPVPVGRGLWLRTRPSSIAPSVNLLIPGTDPSLTQGDTP